MGDYLRGYKVDARSLGHSSCGALLRASLFRCVPRCNSQTGTYPLSKARP